MKCPDCGTVDTRVMETRQDVPGLLVRRRHQCGNGHRFNSFQLHETSLRSTGMQQVRSRLDAVTAGIAARSVAYQRRRTVERMLRAGKTTAQVAVGIGVTQTRVRQIRAELAKINAPSVLSE
jgi:transcriptional regulator NrdR family protein